MDLTPPPVADRPSIGDGALVDLPKGLPATCYRWTNLTIEEKTTGLGPYQTRRDIYTVTLTGGHRSAHPPLHLALGPKYGPKVLRQYTELVTAVQVWREDKDRAWHVPFIHSLNVLERGDTHVKFEVTVEHPYLD